MEINGSETEMMVPTVELGRMEKMVSLSSDRWWYEDGGIVYQKKKKDIWVWASIGGGMEMVGLSSDRRWYEDGGIKMEE